MFFFSNKLTKEEEENKNDIPGGNKFCFAFGRK